jgi:hypothetical protein
MATALCAAIWHPRIAFPRCARVDRHFGDMPEGAAVRAIPGVGTHVPVWTGREPLRCPAGSPSGLARLASHFAPAMLEECSVDLQNSFQTIPVLVRAPCNGRGRCLCRRDRRGGAGAAVLARTCICTLDIRSAWQTAPTSPRCRSTRARPVLAQVRQALSCSATGSPSTVKTQLSIIDKYRPDELW